MKRRRRALCVVLCGVVLALGSLLAKPAVAGFEFQDFSSSAGLIFVDAAAPVDDGLQLTAEAPSQMGAVWHATRQRIAAGFHTRYRVRIDGDGNAAEGLAFVIQDASNMVGGSQGIGYDGTPSGVLAVEFDTRGEVGVELRSGATLYEDRSGSVSPHTLAPLFDLADGIARDVSIHYTPNADASLSVLHLSIDDPGGNDFQQSYALDLRSLLSADGMAYVGFTAGTGELDSRHRVESWSFQSAIRFVGAVEDIGGASEVTDWLTASTAKTHDVDDDEVYGSYARVNFFDLLQGNMITKASGSQFRKPFYRPVDDVDLLPTPKGPAGIAIANLDDNLAFRFQIIGLTGSENVLRLGIMQNVLGEVKDPLDVNKIITVSRVGPPGGSLRFPVGIGGVIPGNDRVDMYFVDLAGVANEDEYELFVTDNGVLNGYVGPVSLDRAGYFASPLGLALPIPDNMPFNPVDHTIEVSSALPGEVLVGVTVALDHPFAGDLSLTLEDPAGRVVTLVHAPSGGGLNGDSSNFASSTPISFVEEESDDVPPADDIGLSEGDGQVVGTLGPTSYAAQGSLADFDGRSPNGSWTLRVSDGREANLGTLDSWSLQFELLARLPGRWVEVGNAGNAADTTGLGAVDHAYEISRYELTNAEYAEFLNAVARSDPNALYNEDMAIARSGSDGSYAYTPDQSASEHSDEPVTHVSWYDALRLANWLHNEKPVGPQGPDSTEDGAYALLGGAPTDVTREPDARFFLPSENEWYKAAHYAPISRSYFDYPTASDAPTSCEAPSGAGNAANCAQSVGAVTAVGAYWASPSPWNTYDQGGNVFEWNEAGFLSGSLRGLRGGSWMDGADMLEAASGADRDPAAEDATAGFRLARLPEPAAGLLGTMALLCIAGLRRRHL